MAIEVVYNLITGSPPVAAPLDNANCHAEGTGLAAGVVIKVDASDAAGATGKAAIANVTGADAVGVTIAAADQDALVRFKWLKPGDVLKATAAAELEVGDTCQFNATLDGFDNGTGTTVKVIRTEKDADGDHKVVYGVLTAAAFY